MSQGLFHRCPSNPILTAADWPYRIHTVFNPGATLLADGSTLLLCRVEDHRGISHLCAARSENGVDGWVIDEQPTFFHNPLEHPEELWGVEDPRITFIPELDRYVVVYTAFGKAGPGVAMATTEDFVSYDRVGLVMQADDKDAAVFPRSFQGEFALIHRPSNLRGADIWISFSPDLQNWGGHSVLLPARLGAWWDSNKVGLSTPPILTSEGWLVLYHGVRKHASGSIYRIGVALFDVENPGVCLRRGLGWIFGPEAPYEIEGDVPYVVFPCGVTLRPDGDTLYMYYGASDTSVCLAVASVQSLLDHLRENGSELTGVAGMEVEQVILDTAP